MCNKNIVYLFFNLIFDYIQFINVIIFILYFIGLFIIDNQILLNFSC